MKHSLQKNCSSYQRVCGSARIFRLNKKFIILTRNLYIKEVAVLKQKTVLTHYIFTSPMLWKFFTRSGRSCASWLNAYHHGWEDGYNAWSRRLYLKMILSLRNARNERGCGTCFYDERERIYIEMQLDAVYEESLICMIVILYDRLRIVLCKMYLKYLIGSCDARKNCKIFNKMY